MPIRVEAALGIWVVLDYIDGGDIPYFVDRNMVVDDISATSVDEISVEARGYGFTPYFVDYSASVP